MVRQTLKHSYLLSFKKMQLEWYNNNENIFFVLSLMRSLIMRLKIIYGKKIVY